MGARVSLYVAEPRETGAVGVAVLAGGACGFCGASCPKAGEMGPPTSVTVSMAANSGRAYSVFIVLLTLKISSPKGLDLYVLNSVKRSQNGICFRQLTVLRSRPKSDSFAATPPGMDWNPSRGLGRAERVKNSV